MTQEEKEQAELEALMASQDDEIGFGEEIRMSSEIDEDVLQANGPVNPNEPNMNYSAQLNYERAEQMEEVATKLDQIPEREDLAIGGMTMFDTQLTRMQTQSHGIQKRAIKFLQHPMGQDTIYAGVLGSQNKDNITLTQATDVFGHAIGGVDNIPRFIKELEMGMRSDDITEASTATPDVRTAYSMLGKTSINYGDSHSNLYASDRNEEQQVKRELRESEAYATALSFATQYVDPNLPEKYREKAIQDNYNFILNRAMETKTAPRIVRSWDGSPMMTTEVVPQTNSLGNLLIGTDYKPVYKKEERMVTASGAMPLPSELPGLGNLPQMNEWSPKKSFELSGVYGTTDVDAKYQKDVDSYKEMEKVFRQSTVTLSDEGYGNKERYVGQVSSKTTEWDTKLELINEAMLLGLEREYAGSVDGSPIDDFVKLRTGEEDTKGLSSDLAYASVTGQRSKVSHEFVGMDNTTGIVGTSKSSGDILSNIQTMISTESVVSPIVEYDEVTPTPDEQIYAFNETNASDRQKYLNRIELNAPPEQRSPEWHKQRMGVQTGSDLLNPNARDATIEKRARRHASGKSDNIPVSLAMAEGIANEPLVDQALVDFLTGNIDPKDIEVNKFESIGQKVKKHKKVTTEEAFFETNPDLPGFGASPDAFVFGADGESLELAEYKYRQSLETLHDIKKEDMWQMQLQMATTKKEGVHFMRMHRDKETGKVSYAYDYVTPDKELLKRILKTNQKALDKAEVYKKGGTMAVSQAQIEDSNKSHADIFEEEIEVADVPVVFDEASGTYSNSDDSDYIGFGRGSTTHAKDSNSPMMDEAKLENKAFDKKKVQEKKNDTNLTSQTRREIEARKLNIELIEGSTESQKRQIMLAKEKEQADRASVNASKKASDGLAKVGKATLSLITQLGKAGINAIAEQMDDVQLGAMIGSTSTEAKGSRIALQNKGLTETQSKKTLLNVSDMQSTLRNEGQGGIDMLVSQIFGGYTSAANEANIDWFKFKEMGTIEGAAYLTDQLGQIKDPTKLKDAVTQSFRSTEMAIAISGGMKGDDFYKKPNRAVVDDKVRALHSGTVRADVTARDVLAEGVDVIGDKVGYENAGYGLQMASKATEVASAAGNTAKVVAGIAAGAGAGGLLASLKNLTPKMGNLSTQAGNAAKMLGKLALPVSALIATLQTAGLLKEGIKETLDRNNNLPDDYSTPTSEDRDTIEASTLEWQSKNSNMVGEAGVNYWDNLKKVGQINSQEKKEKEKVEVTVTTDLKVGNEETEVKQEIKCNDKLTQQIDTITNN